MFTSPLDYCPQCRQLVALDQTRAMCAAEHHCVATHCPLQQYFTTASARPEPAPVTGADVTSEHRVAL